MAKTSRSVTDEPIEDELDLRIDPNQLDKEWLGQPRFYHRYATKLSIARIKEDEAKQQLDLMMAETELAVRKSPEDYGCIKQTEGEIKAAILRQPEYIRAQKALTKARYATSIYAAAVTALDHRRKALENLVQLHGQDYFSAPRAKGEKGKEAIKDITKSASRGIAKYNEENWEDDDNDSDD